MNPRLLFVAALSLCASIASVHAQSVPQRVRAEVVTLDGTTLRLKTPNGEILSAKLTDSARISIESRVDLSALVPGVFVGTTSAPQADGSLRAVQIRIFPETLRGTGEGHRLMSAQGGNTMTNATVTALSPPPNTMTNATVTALAGTGAARSMTLTFKEGEKQVFIPADVPVIQTEIGDRAALTPGAYVIATITPQTDGSATTDRVTVGKNGSKPF